MSSRVEQFASNLEGSPQGEFEKGTKVPKSLRAESRRAVRGAVMAEQKKIATDDATGVESEMSPKERKVEAAKTALKETVERDRKESKKMLAIFQYLPEQALAGAGQYAVDALGGEKRAGSLLVRLYLAQERLPPKIQQLLEQTEEQIVSKRKVGDRDISISEDDLIGELSHQLSAKITLRDKDFSQAILEYVVEEGVISNDHLKTAIAASMDMPDDGRRKEVVTWINKEEPQLAELSNKQVITAKQREKLEKLQDRPAYLRRRNGGRDVVESVQRIKREEVDKVGEIGASVNSVEEKIKDITEDWQGKLEDDFEQAFDENF